MSQDDNSIRAIREAIQISPDNVPLRKHLAETLFALGHYEESEMEYREALAMTKVRH